MMREVRYSGPYIVILPLAILKVYELDRPTAANEEFYRKTR